MRSASLPALIFSFTLGACASDEVDDADAESAEFRALTDGLLLHWTFEDSVGTQVTDVSGNGRHGTLQGAVLVASPNGQAASLDGVDDWIALTSPPRAPALHGGSARYYLDCQADAVLTDANLGLLDVGSSSVGRARPRPAGSVARSTSCGSGIGS